MTGSIKLSAPSYLPTLFAPGAVGDSLLAAVFGQAGPEPGAVNPIAVLEPARSGETGQGAPVAAEPQVKRDSAQVIQAPALAKTPTAR